MLHVIHCIQSGCILPGCLESMHSSHCMDSTAYNRDPLRHNAWNPLHSMTLHGIHCIQLGCFWPCCITSTAFNHAAWNPLHSIMLHGIHCIQSCCKKSTAFNMVPFLHAAWHTLHSNTLHGIHCIPWNQLHSIGMLWAMLDNIHSIQSGFIGPRCLESTAFNHAA